VAPTTTTPLDLDGVPGPASGATGSGDDGHASGAPRHCSPPGEVGMK